MDCNQYSQSSKFVELLNSQQQTVFGFSQESVEQTAERKEMRKWSPVHDLVLISSWLNTSKDPVVGNEQRCGTFWKRIAAYFAASPKVAVSEQRDWSHCKQRWQKINDIVNKLCGAYEAASREKRSGQNENDMVKLAHEIFYNNHKKKFNLEHAWKELRNDQKWCEVSTSKTQASAKRRKFEDGAQSSSSQVNETTTAEDDQGSNRPPGVKAAKGFDKKKMAESKALIAFESMWSIKKEEMALKEKMTKMKLLDSLLAKNEPLAEYEEALKKKLINELLCT
ncbi:PREDICTED: glutathione S-transferase T3-like [Brassica oleracea var. oleracea]|uniref:No apical meristem-associated C-terminal domain-containing protein n=1 Tax=Brassica oleracea var. oleracea TaxID=109376 RepID=A0A0D3BLX7_BRAOL|nr:PREDICTED: glutathione S-transferase T3-like [Brassica oleracea var. oleracea]